MATDCLGSVLSRRHRELMARGVLFSDLTLPGLMYFTFTWGCGISCCLFHSPSLRASLGYTHIVVFSAPGVSSVRGTFACALPSAGVCRVTRVKCEGQVQGSPKTDASLPRNGCFLLFTNGTPCMSAICRRYPVAGCRDGALVLEHLSPNLTLAHWVSGNICFPTKNWILYSWLTAPAWWEDSVWLWIWTGFINADILRKKQKEEP